MLYLSRHRNFFILPPRTAASTTGVGGWNPKKPVFFYFINDSSAVYYSNACRVECTAGVMDFSEKGGYCMMSCKQVTALN